MKLLSVLHAMIQQNEEVPFQSVVVAQGGSEAPGRGEQVKDMAVHCFRVLLPFLVVRESSSVRAAPTIQLWPVERSQQGASPRRCCLATPCSLLL